MLWWFKGWHNPFICLQLTTDLFSLIHCNVLQAPGCQEEPWIFWKETLTLLEELRKAVLKGTVWNAAQTAMAREQIFGNHSTEGELQVPAHCRDFVAQIQSRGVIKWIIENRKKELIQYLNQGKSRDWQLYDERERERSQSVCERKKNGDQY